MSENKSNKLTYWSKSAENKFDEFRLKFDSIKSKYWNLNQNDSSVEIKNALNETYEFSRLFLDFFRQTSNIIKEYKKILSEENLIPPISLTVTDSQDSEMVDFISVLSENVSSLKDKKDSISSTIVSVPRDLKDAEFFIKTEENDVLKKETILSDAQNKLADCFVVAPFDGVITEINVETQDSVTTSTVVATIITHQKIAKISLNEVDTAKVKLGQKANITFDAIDGLNITGQVIEIDSVGTVSQGVVSYNAVVAFDIQDEKIKSGMSVSSSIITDTKQNILIVPNSAVKSKSDETYYVLVFDENKELIQKIVEIGLADDINTEIVSGLAEGDEIISKTISAVKTSPAGNSNGTNNSTNRATQNLMMGGGMPPSR
jgi:RND family efflux transporter MFP subunit